jgi:hypothetical protein
MNGRGFRNIWISRLPILLVLTQLCLALTGRGQNAPQAGAESASATPPAPESFQEAAPNDAPSTRPGAGDEQGFGSWPSSQSDWGASDADVPNSRTSRPFEPNNVPFDPATGLPASGGSANADPFSTRPFGLGYVQNPNLGQAEGTVSFSLTPLSSFPLIYRAFPPEDANLKAGPVYLKFERAEADMYYSDNYNLSATDRRSEVLAILSLNMTLIAQLSEDLQFSVNGTLIYLPLQNIVGLESSSLNGTFLLVPLPTLLSQVTYDTVIAGWAVRFQDQFGSGPGSYSDSAAAAFNLFDGSYLQQNNNGKYSFHSGRVDIRGNSSDDIDNRDNNFFYFFYNTISAYTDRYIEDDILLTAIASRTDLWYDEQNLGLPSSFENFFAEAQSVRENLRFKPFVAYDISHSSDVPGVFQFVYAGLSGPITDQLFLYASVGYYFSSDGAEGSLWDLTLRHDAGPYTTEWLQIARGLNDFNDEVVTTEYYRLGQVLGPTLYGSIIADHTSFQELARDQVSNSDREDAGAQLTWTLGPKTWLNLTAIYSHQDIDNGPVIDSWIGRIDFDRQLSDTVFFRALYQYQRYNVNQPGQGYFENIVFLSLAKYFP